MLSLFFAKVFACENFKTWYPLKFSHAKTWAHIDAKTNIYIIFLVKYRLDYPHWKFCMRCRATKRLD